MTDIIRPYVYVIPVFGALPVTEALVNLLTEHGFDAVSAQPVDALRWIRRTDVAVLPSSRLTAPNSWREDASALRQYAHCVSSGKRVFEVSDTTLLDDALVDWAAEWESRQK
jgi:hypothetical protein